jgi:hypothetical protein
MHGGKVFCSMLLIVALPLGYVSTAWGETYYRWTDDRGNPVHSDRPPPKGVDYEVVSTQSSLLRPVTADEGAVPLETEPKVGNEFQPVDTAKLEVEKKSPEYCQRAKDNLATLSESVRIRIRNDQGEYRYLNDEEKAAQREQAQKMVERHCE